MRKTAILDGMGWPRLASLALTLVAIGAACSSGEEDGRQLGVGQGTGSTSSGNGGSGLPGSGGTGPILPGSGGQTGTGGDRPQECDAAGNCVCIGVAVFGQQGEFGAVPGMDGVSAIQQWLNDNSTAEAALFREKPAITAEFLAPYHVIILEDPRAVKKGALWQYTAEDIAAIETWVRTAPEGQARGIISLTGYSNDTNEVNPTNQLLAFSGMQYVGASDTLATNPETQCAYCLGNSVPEREWNALHPIAANLTAVGAFHGRSISVTGAGVETVTTSGTTVLGAAAQVDLGRVFMFHDEWVTYNSQWNGEGLPQGSDCRHVADGGDIPDSDLNHQCLDIHPSTTYQTSTFWYNALRWAAGDPACLKIEDPTIIK